jgi:hypothetical protein
MESKLEKDSFRDSRGRPLTQSLFLEFGYNTEYAVYTTREEDYEYRGKLYFSLKALYLEHEDPTEYDFACTHLLNWNQWKRITKNKLFMPYHLEWQEELELKLRSAAVQDIRELATGDKGFQAAKWLANRGWDTRKAGRPTNEEREHENNMQSKIDEEFADDVERMDKMH